MNIQSYTHQPYTQGMSSFRNADINPSDLGAGNKAMFSTKPYFYPQSCGCNSFGISRIISSIVQSFTSMIQSLVSSFTGNSGLQTNGNMYLKNDPYSTQTQYPAAVDSLQQNQAAVSEKKPSFMDKAKGWIDTASGIFNSISGLFTGGSSGGGWLSKAASFVSKLF